MTTVLIVILSLGLLFFNVAFLFDWFRLRTQIRKYLKYGVWVAFIIVGLDLLLVGITPSIWTAALIIGLFADAIAFIKAIGLTMLGMYYCDSLGYPSFPLISKRFTVQNSSDTHVPQPVLENNTPTINENSDTIPQEGGASGEIIPSVNTPSTITAEPTPILLQINWKRYIVSVLTIVILGVAYSILLFILTKPHMSEAVQRIFTTPSPETENAFTLQGVVAVLGVALSEEVFFRLTIQNFLAKYMHLQGKKYWIAIVMTAALWTLGHAGVLTPEWVKLAQIFPIGLMLGWLFRKYGAESTILAHGLFNLLLLFSASYLIR